MSLILKYILFKNNIKNNKVKILYNLLKNRFIFSLRD